MKGKKRYPLTFALLVLCFYVIILASILYIKNHSINILSQSNTVQMQIGENNNVLVPEASGKALLNYKVVKLYWVFDLAWSFLVPILFIISGLSEQLKQWCERKTKRFYLSIALYLGAFYTIIFLLDLPLIYFGGFFRTHLLGMSSQSLVHWFANRIKDYALNIFIIAFFSWIPYGIIRRYTKKWWLITGVLLLPFIIVSTLITPLYIDPMYNKFYSLEDKKLESKILDLAEKAGIKDCSVYVVNKSIETNTMNAYMTGLFSTKRIVIWDTSLKGLNEKELLVVVAHEIGHYVLGHIPKSIALGGFSAFFVLFLVNKTTLSVIRRLKGRFSINNITDLNAIPVIIIVINLYTFAFSPFSNAYSRHIEKDADKFAIELTKDNYSSATSEIKFLNTNLGVPKPDFVYWLWNYTHPTVEERIRFSNEYKPWEKGEKLQFEKYIK